MILNNGIFNGKQVLSAQSIKEMERSQTSGLQVEGTPEIAKGLEYGLGEWIMEKNAAGNTTEVSSPGLFGCWPVVNISKKYAWILFVKNNQHARRKQIMEDLRNTIHDLIN